MGDQGILFSLKRMDIRALAVLVIASGLIIRLVLMPLLTYGFDSYHWGIIVQNINSGNRLYELTGYFYTPVWGYIISFTDMICNNLLSIGVIGERFTDLFEIENLRHIYHSATTTSPGFNVAFKLPLVLCDLVVGYVIFWLVRKWTGDVKKGTYALALWFLCPIVIYMSGIQAMFDTVSALSMILCAILLWKKYYMFGGLIFSITVFLKFFPGFCILVMLAYILVRHREDGKAVQNIVRSAIGFTIGTLIIFLPNILDGNVMDTLSFVLDRMSNPADVFNTIYTYIGIAIALFCMIFSGYRMYKSPVKDLDKNFFINLLCALCGAVLLSPTPQYVIVLLPLLIFHIVTFDRSYMVCWMMIGVGMTVAAFSMNGFSLLAATAEYYHLVSPDTIINYMVAMETPILSIPAYIWILSASEGIGVVGIILIFVFVLEERIRRISAGANRFMNILKPSGGAGDHEQK